MRLRAATPVLTDRTVSFLREAFDLCAENGRGAHDALAEILGSVRGVGGPLGEPEMRALAARARSEQSESSGDIEEGGGSGGAGLRFEEFLVVVSMFVKDDSRAVKARDLFSAFDIDRSGQITVEELRRSAQSGLSIDITVEEAVALVSFRDLKNSDILDRDEFRAIVREVRRQAARRSMPVCG